MSILVVFLSLLFLVTGQVFSAVHVTTNIFSTSNCNHWPIMEQDISTYTVVNLRSKLECASECAKMKCYCYKYLKQTSVCRLSSKGTTIETDGWLCLPVPSPRKICLLSSKCRYIFSFAFIFCLRKKIKLIRYQLHILGVFGRFFSPKFLHKFNVLLNCFLQKYNTPQCSKIPCLLAGIEAETIFLC